jgi:hypothetical protein
MSLVNYQKFGVLKIEGKQVKMYSSQNSFGSINVGEEISDARWNGDKLMVSLKNGKVRLYTSQNSYSTI